MGLNAGEDVICTIDGVEYDGFLVDFCGTMCRIVQLDEGGDPIHILKNNLRPAVVPIRLLCNPEDVTIVRHGDWWVASCAHHGTLGSIESKDESGLGLFPREGQQPIRDHFPDTRIEFFTDWSWGICRVLAQDATWA